MIGDELGALVSDNALVDRIFSMPTLSDKASIPEPPTHLSDRLEALAPPRGAAIVTRLRAYDTDRSK